MSYVKNFSGQILLKFENDAIKDFYGAIKYRIRDNKVFDFVIKTNRCTYLIEVNFYHGGGSKPNETARSYTEVAPKVNSVEGYEFVWITDGVGWIKAKAMFTAAYKVIPNIYNLTHIQEFISKIKEEE